MIGARAWERRDGGPWAAVPAAAGLLEQIYAYLPRVAAAPPMAVQTRGALAELTWYDDGRAADVALEIDAGTGNPRHLRRVARRTGEILTVSYGGWNVPVEITPPPAAP